MLCNFVGIFLDCFTNIFRPSNDLWKNAKYNVVICAIFKNEAPYLKEWIEYHKIVGVEHFYLYNNDSTDNYEEVLKKYIDYGLVTIINFPNIGKEYAQQRAYMSS